MAAVETVPGFIRPDGKEKVTGTGRYTADLNLTGMAHAKFRYADHAHARILGIDTSKASALPGVVAVVTQDQLPDVRFGSFVQDRYLFAKDVVRFEGEIVAGVAALRPEIAAEAARLIEIDYEPLPAIADFEKSMEAGAPLIHPDLASYDKDENIVANGNTMAYHDRQGRRRRRHGDRRRRRQGPLCLRRVAGRPDRAARGHRGVAGRQGHRLVLDAGALRGASRCGPDPGGARGRRPRDRAASAGLRRQVRSALRGPGRGARSRAAKRPVARVLPRGGVPRDRSAPRGHRHGVRDRRDATDGSSPARRGFVLDKGAYCGEGEFLGQMAAMHACGPYIIDAIHVEAYPELHQQPALGSVRAPTAPQVCWGLEQHGRGRPCDRHGSRRLRRRTLIEEGAEGRPARCSKRWACATRSRPPSR